MQGCQALIDHVDNILEDAPEAYREKDVKNVRNGLKFYNKYIQAEIVTPGLLKFNGGDEKKAKAMQAQVDAYKKTVPSGDDLEVLKVALTTMLELAKL